MHLVDPMLSSQIQPTSTFIFVEDQQDVIADMLRNTRCANTRKAYAASLRDFFLHISGREPSALIVNEFLALERRHAVNLVMSYRAKLLDKNLKEATINCRLAAIRSMVCYAQELEKCTWNLKSIKGETVTPYRDTTGVEAEQFYKILAAPDRQTLKGKRDYAILQLLWANALRRNEIAQTKVADFDADSRKLTILGKGKGTQTQEVTLPRLTVEAIAQWLEARGEYTANSPLFIALDNASYGKALSGDGLYYLVKTIAKEAGIKKLMSPHRCRHSSITAALQQTNGNIRKVQELSRHAKPETLIRYDDNRKNEQAGVSELLSAGFQQIADPIG